MEYNILVHYQFMPDDGKVLEQKILPYGPRVSASIVPNLLDTEMTFENGKKIRPEVHGDNNFYSEQSKIRLGMLPQVDSPVFIEGYRHCCEECFEKGKDPYHEYVCADKTAQDIVTQFENTNSGIELIAKNLGISKIIGVVPPNHQGNEDTKEITKILNIPYFVVRNALADYATKVHSPIKLNLPAWEEYGLKILPESKIPGKAPLLYIMYGDIVENGWGSYERFFEKSVPLEELEIKNKKPRLANLSERVLYWGKRRRDKKKIKKLLG